ncbi:flavodoxin [Blastopirellula sp. JC732]|uniref:Flavodoxin n=1 Tax=Blastopirellula sediminis TaxID=2894196 RepID=A0A9X1MR77_9BACT|nr:flavodoxin [Blastopirellula sediminis]MCC9606154.1 flavodoxin [Blastopirellula sediminis]MCC9630547.1 flavodoxin [Blastopirellula sediminis]
MNKVGLFFGTDSGTTRLIGKKIAKLLGADLVDKPLNINRATIDDLLQYDVLILGTATYGAGELPGVANNAKDGSWIEFLPQLAGADFTGKTVALYGLGDQEKYGDRFVNGMAKLYRIFKDLGATIVGEWSAEGYTFTGSDAVLDGKFVGLAIDNNSQGMLTDARLSEWTAAVKPQLEAALTASSQVG